MAIIGLYDFDMAKYIHVPFNLELMKLSSYYKHNNQIVAMAGEIDAEKYTKIIVRKDYQDGDFPKDFLYPNVEVGGFALSDGQYIPFDESIERSQPDLYIYNRYKPLFCTMKSMELIWRAMCNACHMRLSLDGKNLWPRATDYFDKHYDSIFIHDYDLNQVKDAEILITDLVKCATHPIYFGNKFPIQTYNVKDLFKWTNWLISNSNFALQYNGLLEDEPFCQLLYITRGTSLLPQFNYNITYGCTDEHDFIINRLPQIFLQVTFSRINQRRISLKYEDHFFIHPELELLVKLLNSYAASAVFIKDPIVLKVVRECDTLFSYARSLNKWALLGYTYYNLEEIRNVFNFIRAENYELFTQFYELSKVELKGGKLVNVTSRYSRAR